MSEEFSFRVKYCSTCKNSQESQIKKKEHTGVRVAKRHGTFMEIYYEREIDKVFHCCNGFAHDKFLEIIDPHMIRIDIPDFDTELVANLNLIESAKFSKGSIILYWDKGLYSISFDHNCARQTFESMTTLGEIIVKHFITKSKVR